MGKYFTIEELTKTNTGLDNTPNEQITSNLNELIEVLDGLREAWTSLCNINKWGAASIVVNSGYRSEAVNKAVGGSKTSSHKTGWAVDIEPRNQRNKEFYEFCKDYFNNNNILFDQLINEKPRNGIPSWIHLGLYNSKGEQRHQIFTLV